MPGVNDTIPTELNPALLDPQKLVNTNVPTISPSAVQALTDSMRSGALTAQDVLDRSGELGKLHRKAQIELHKRQIADLQDPDLVAARHAVEIAQGQTATLGGAQATAAMPLVQPSAALQGTQLAKATAEAKHGSPGSVDAYTSIYGDIPTLANGQPDYELAAVKGSQVRGGQAWFQFASERQKPDPALTQKIPRAGGGEDIIYHNAQGENVTPGSPKWKEYEDIKAKAFPLHNLTPGSSAQAAPAAAPAAPEPTGAERARLVNEQGIPPAQAATMSAADVQSKLASPAPMVSPRSPGPGEYNPATGGTVIQSGEIPKVNEITEPLQKDKAYEDWVVAKSRYNDLRSAMDQINKVPVADQRAGKTNLNSQDLALAESVIKMFDPQGTVREFKWEKIERNQPIVARVNDFREQLMRSGTLTPEARQALAQIGTQHIQSIEREALNPISRAATRAQAAGHPLANVLNPAEVSLLNGQRTPNYVPPKEFGGPASPKPGEVKTLSNGMKVYQGADGQFYPAQ